MPSKPKRAASRYCPMMCPLQGEPAAMFMKYSQLAKTRGCPSMEYMAQSGCASQVAAVAA